ncbi:MAG TPA: hypothetical protein VJT81_09005 [Burkholderiales bacterium]|nr:hypothetical protein [Burkholderiales bacterium]
MISGFIVITAQSVATADVTMIPNTETSGSFSLDRDAPLRDRLECAQPISQQIRENLAPSTQDNRAYLDSDRREPGNFPSGELEAPNILALMRIPLERTAAHPLSPNHEAPVQNEEASQVLDLAGDPLHLQLTHPRPNGLC